MTPWTDDVQAIVDGLPDEFTTKDVVDLGTPALELQHPENTHISAKIRQQLQVLRDKRKTIVAGKQRGTWMKVKVAQ